MAGIKALVLTDFSGGLNLRDAPSQVADSETPDCMNVTLDERGGVVKRLGLTKWGGTQLNSSPTSIGFYSQIYQYLYVQQGTSIYRSNDGVTWSGALKTFTTSARIALCEFQDKIVVVHPVDGVWVSANGTTFTQTAGGANAMETIKGNTIAVWQNKCWVGGDPNQKPRVYFSAAGDPTTWNNAGSGSGTVDIREKDNSLVTALGTGEGMDEAGRPGLLVFKEESCYRINSSTTGSFTTVDNDYGAAGPLAVASAAGLTAALSKRGVLLMQGTGDQNAVLVSRKLDPLFRADQLAFGTSANWCCGTVRDKVVLSLARFGSSVNNLTLEMHPTLGWFVPHSFGAPWFETWAKDDYLLFSGHNTAGYVYKTFVGATDDGSTITSRWQSRWFEPTSGFEMRPRRMLVSGRGQFSMYVKKNYSSGQGELNAVSSLGDAFTWDTSTWGGGTWGPQAYEDYGIFFEPTGVCRSISFVFYESTANTATAPPLLQDGASVEVGCAALYGLHLDYIGLEPA